jgi:hypothetical protein
LLAFVSQDNAPGSAFVEGFVSGWCAIYCSGFSIASMIAVMKLRILGNVANKATRDAILKRDGIEIMGSLFKMVRRKTKRSCTASTALPPLHGPSAH